MCGETKASKEEKIWAQNFMTDDIKKFRDEKEKLNQIQKVQAVLNVEKMETQAEKNKIRRLQEKRLKKMRGGKNNGN